MIEKINSKFSDAFDDRIDDVKFVNPFKTSYRLSTRYVFDKLKKFINDSIVGNTYNYYLALVVISHVFNRIFL
jgi:nucleosome binding factor SPN SPT16 subunit